ACGLALQTAERGITDETWAFIDRKAWDPDWELVLLFFAGKVRSPERLLALLSEPAPTATNPWGDDVFGHRLALAGQAPAEIPTPVRQRHQEQVNRNTTEVFSLWWEHECQETTEAIAALSGALPSLARANGCLLRKPWLLRAGHGRGATPSGSESPTPLL